PLAQYAGTYVDSMYGAAQVREENGKLVLQRGPSFTGELEHWHFDTFRSNWRDRTLGKTFVTFRLGPTGKPEELAMDVGGSTTAFKRRPETADTTAGVVLAAADVRKYLGVFQSMSPPISITVEEVAGRMRITLPGQQYTMVPVTPTRFKLVGANLPAGFFLVYTMEADKVKSVTLEQPLPRPSLVLSPIASR